jgi:hypothetical protein
MGDGVSRRLPRPFDEPDPLKPHRLALHDLVMPLPAPGRYELLVLANGVEMSMHTPCFQLPVVGGPC